MLTIHFSHSVLPRYGLGVQHGLDGFFEKDTFTMSNNRLFTIAASFALSAGALATSPAALAKSANDVSTCRAAVAEALGSRADAATINFESSSGASLKTIVFTVREDADETKATCKIKRGKVRSVDV